MSDAVVVDLCGTCKVRLDECPFDGLHPETQAKLEGAEQVGEAKANLLRGPEQYLRWPWPDLDALYGGMAPGTVHYVVGFSGTGKTTFATSALDRWVKAGVKVDVLPLELKANTFRTYLACQALGIDPGYVLSGDYWGGEAPPMLRARIIEKMEEQAKDPAIRIRSVEFVDVAALESAAVDAFDRKAQVLLVDHIDHVSGGDGKSDFQASKAVNEAALRIAKDTGLVLLLMSQANNEALKGSRDKLAKYNVLADNCVWMGAYKRQIATGMLSLFRPLQPLMPGQDAEVYGAQLARCRAGEDPPGLALWPGRAGISLMKSRTYGGREGQRIHLKVRDGYYTDLDMADKMEDEQRRHGIATHTRGAA